MTVHVTNFTIFFFFFKFTRGFKVQVFENSAITVCVKLNYKNVNL